MQKFNIPSNKQNNITLLIFVTVLRNPFKLMFIAENFQQFFNEHKTIFFIDLIKFTIVRKILKIQKL